MCTYFQTLMGLSLIHCFIYTKSSFMHIERYALTVKRYGVVLDGRKLKGTFHFYFFSIVFKTKKF